MFEDGTVYRPGFSCPYAEIELVDAWNLILADEEMTLQELENFLEKYEFPSMYDMDLIRFNNIIPEDKEGSWSSDSLIVFFKILEMPDTENLNLEDIKIKISHFEDF